MLLRYTGDRTRHHLLNAGSYVEEFGKIYRFNALGFRCEDFDPTAKLKVFLCGCSAIFGTALNDDETFGHHLKRELSIQRGLSLPSVNVQNFAAAGASNDYITRMALTQCSRAKPDVLFVLFTLINRAECILDESPEGGSSRIASLGPWCIDEENWNPYDFDSDDVSERARFYYGYYERPVGVLQFFRNALLLQYYCRANSIRLLFAVMERDLLSDPFVTENEAVAPLNALLDRSLLVKLPRQSDLGADNSHPGPLSNQARAKAVAAAIMACGIEP